MNNSVRFLTAANLSLVRILPVLVVLLLTGVVLLPSTPVVYLIPDTDNAIFLLIGDKIRAGDLPFRDWYDHKPPLIFYLNALGLWLGQGSRWGVWAVELVSLSAAGMFAFAFLRRFFGTLVAVLSVSATLINLVFVLERGNLTEEYALPFQFAAIFLVSQVEQTKKAAWAYFLIGAALAMASSLKQPLAGVGAAIGIYFAFEYVRQNRWLDLVRAYGWLAFGFAVVWAVWFLYFATMGIFAEFWEAAFAYNMAISTIPLERRLQALVSALNGLFGMSSYFLAAMLAWLAGLSYLLTRDERLLSALLNRRVGLLMIAAGAALFFFGLLNQPVLSAVGFPLVVMGILSPTGWSKKWRKRRLECSNQEHRSLLFLPLFIALVDLPVALAFTTLSGANFGHYFMALLPSLTLLTAFLLHSILNLFRSEAGLPLRYAWLLVFLLPVFVPGIVETESRMGLRGDRQVEAVVRYVTENTRPGDHVFQWGIVPQINLLSGRDSPSRYFVANHIFVDGYSGKEQTDELLRAFQANPPVLIIDQGIPRLPLLMPAANSSCEAVKDVQMYEKYMENWKQRGSYQFPKMPEGMTGVYYWICQNYEPAGPVGELEWQVYRLKGT